MTKLVLSGDKDAVYSRLDVMLDVITVLENARKQAGIFYPGDEEA